MLSELSYDEALQKADALRTLGQTTVHLWKDGDARPWHLATSCEPGSSFRLSIPVSATFRGVDGKSGLTFVWSFDLENHNANGSSEAKINLEACRNVLKALRGDALVQFRKYLSDVSTLVKARGDEYQAVADRQFRDAAVLRDLVNS